MSDQIKAIKRIFYTGLFFTIAGFVLMAFSFFYFCDMNIVDFLSNYGISGFVTTSGIVMAIGGVTTMVACKVKGHI